MSKARAGCFVSMVVWVFGACDSPGSKQSGGTTGTNGTVDRDATADTEVAFAANCPSTIFEHMTCVSAAENDVCPGAVWCEACLANEATTCTCLPYDAGFEWRCAAPACECTVNPNDPDATGEVAPAWEADGACKETNSGITLCTEYRAGDRPDDAESRCATNRGAWSATCPTADAVGYCEVPGTRTYVYPPTTADDGLAVCGQVGGVWQSIEP